MRGDNPPHESTERFDEMVGVVQYETHKLSVPVVHDIQLFPAEFVFDSLPVILPPDNISQKASNTRTQHGP